MTFCALLGLVGPHIPCREPFVLSFDPAQAERAQAMTYDTLKRTSHYSANRRNYISPDGSYVYWHWDDELKKEVPMYLTPGKDGVTQEWLIFLDEADNDEDLQDRYAEENADYGFRNRQAQREDENADSAESADMIPAKNGDPLDLLCAEEPTANPQLEQLVSFMDKLTPAQRDLIYDHFGALKQFTEIRDDENAADGTDKSVQSVFNRMDKILTRACKEFGVEKPRKKR